MPVAQLFSLGCFTMQTPFFKLGLATVALIAASGCVHFSDVTYPFPHQDMGIVADSDERGLTVTSAVTNAAFLPSESFLIDGRGRRYSLHIQPLEPLKGEPPYPRYYITAFGPVPAFTPVPGFGPATSDSRFLFGEGLYIISLAYTNTVSAKQGVVTRAFVIERKSMSYPSYYIMAHGH
jgi:hypothetical protein